MKLDTELLLAATDALHAAERDNESIELTRDGTSRYTIRDRARPPMQNILWEGDDFAAANLELNVIRDARRVTVVAKVIAAYERARIWKLAADAVSNATLPQDTNGIPEAVQAVLNSQTPAQAAITGGKVQKNFDLQAVLEAAKLDLSGS